MSRFIQGTWMDKDIIIIPLEKSTFFPRDGTPCTVGTGFYIYINGKPSLSSPNDKDYVDVVVIGLRMKRFREQST